MNVLLINYPKGDIKDSNRIAELVAIIELSTSSLYNQLKVDKPFNLDIPEIKTKCKITRLDNGNVTIKFLEEESNDGR